MDFIGIIGGLASIIGAYVSIKQSREAKKAKNESKTAQKEVEKIRDKFFQKNQHDVLSNFQKDCVKFSNFLQNASYDRDAQGQEENYVEIETDSFLSKFNIVISSTSSDTRTKLERLYNTINITKSTEYIKKKDKIANILNAVRELIRIISDFMVNYKLDI